MNRPLALLLGLAALAGFPVRTLAVTVVVKNLDLPAQGFNDPTPAAPVGGNPGATLGQQRINVFERAAALWGAALVGTVPIEVHANFAALPCTGGETVLGHARPTAFVADVAGLPANTWYAVTLANQLAGRDLAPGEPEIEATFNGGLLACTGGKQDWYYGFDGQNGDQNDLLHVVLHELGHGLGFLSLIDPITGESPDGRLDPYTAHVVESSSGQAWSSMTEAQRVAGARSARNLAWDGVHVGRQSRQILALGSPVIRTTPALPGLAGHLAEGEFGRYLGAGAVSGPLELGTLSTGTCGFEGVAPGAVVLLRQTACAPIQQAYNAQQAGAAAVLIMDRQDREPPLTVDTYPSYRPRYPVSIPVLAVTPDDAQLLAGAAPGTTVQLAPEGDTRVGADSAGRALLYATDPIDQTSSVSHWEVLARPNLLMEPYASPDGVHDLRMELALFRDLGWTTTCGNGAMDSGEACDQGPQNGAPGVPCRADCTMAPAAAAPLADAGTIGGIIGGVVGADAGAVNSAGPQLTRDERLLVGGCSYETGGGAPEGLGVVILGGLLVLVRRRTRTR